MSTACVPLEHVAVSLYCQGTKLPQVADSSAVYARRVAVKVGLSHDDGSARVMCPMTSAGSVKYSTLAEDHAHGTMEKEQWEEGVLHGHHDEGAHSCLASCPRKGV